MLLATKVKYGTVCYTIKCYKDTGSIENWPKSGRKRSVRTAKLIKATRMKLTRNNRRSLRTMAAEAQVGCETMQKIVREDLKMYPYKLQKCQLLSEPVEEKRLKRAKLLLNWMKSGTQASIIWTDEKLFTVQAVHNPHNDRIFGQNLENIPINERSMLRRQKLAFVMVWVCVTSRGKKTPIVFIPEGVKVNKNMYLAMLSDEVLPWME